MNFVHITFEIFICLLNEHNRFMTSVANMNPTVVWELIGRKLNVYVARGMQKHRRTKILLVVVTVGVEHI